VNALPIRPAPMIAIERGLCESLGMVVAPDWMTVIALSAISRIAGHCTKRNQGGYACSAPLAEWVRAD
jgi:hypothetical protein